MTNNMPWTLVLTCEILNVITDTHKELQSSLDFTQTGWDSLFSVDLSWALGPLISVFSSARPGQVDGYRAWFLQASQCLGLFQSQRIFDTGQCTWGKLELNTFELNLVPKSQSGERYISLYPYWWVEGLWEWFIDRSPGIFDYLQAQFFFLRYFGK